MPSALPSVDLSPFATGADHGSTAAMEQAAIIDETCRELGFLLAVGHGIAESTKQALLDAMQGFFALPAEEKESISIAGSTCHRGYVGFGAEALEGALAGSDDLSQPRAGDLKETIDSGVEHGPDHPEVLAGTPLHGPNRLPDLPGFREAWQAYFDEATEASLRAHRGLAVALGLPSTWFEDLGFGFMYHLRMLHYPATSRVTPAPGQPGCGTHTDYGSVTVLTDDGIGGLQVRTRDGDWLDVVVPDGCAVVNLGDLMAIWTNDRYVSNPHRVVNPSETDRYSIPFFVEPGFHTRIECLPTCRGEDGSAKHEPMVTGEYLLGRFDGTHAYRNELLN
ncbi:MAG: isopenicillin N synthase family dioxygenase [Ilumatobacteraceae bacterium]